MAGAIASNDTKIATIAWHIAAQLAYDETQECAALVSCSAAKLPNSAAAPPCSVPTVTLFPTQGKSRKSLFQIGKTGRSRPGKREFPVTREFASAAMPDAGLFAAEH